MANIKSAIKRIRVARKKTMHNKPIRSSIKTYVKKAEQSIQAGEPETQAAIKEAISALDKAAAKGVIHKNNASRHKARLMAKYNKAQSAE